jgi:tetratricopeptide (TPR) repeat protein
MELDSSIENPVEDSSAAVEKIVREKILLAYSDNSKWQEAIELLQQALTSNLNIEIQYFNDACWHGSLWGNAAQALPLCEQAVAMDPLATYVHDSRGLARALTGNYQGAIEDFQFFVDEGPRQGQGQQYISKRQQWVVDLKAGKNPFTPELLEMLKHE